MGLGSNLEAREGHMYVAVHRLDALLVDLVRAPLYQTAALDYLDQGDFLNTVIRGRSDLTPQQLLVCTAEIERKGFRKRRGVVPKGPRTIDIDILLCDDRIYRQEASEQWDLIIPHPRMHMRLFVLKPLLDLDPELKDPNDGIPWRNKASQMIDQRVMLYRYD